MQRLSVLPAREDQSELSMTAQFCCWAGTVARDSQKHAGGYFVFAFFWTFFTAFFDFLIATFFAIFISPFKKLRFVRTDHAAIRR